MDVTINGQHSSLDPGDEDAITLPDASDYAVLVTGRSGGVLYPELLTPDEIRAMDGRLVVSAVVVSPS